MLKEDFFKLEEIPSFDSFEITELINYYDYLCEQDYTYTCLNSSNIEIIITLSFLRENFVHLVSLDKVVPKKYPYKEIISNLENKIWDKNNLKKFNENSFKDVKKRMRLLTLVHRILEKPEIISFNPNLVIPKSSILSSFLITDIYSNQYIHLGIDGPNTTNGKYFPRTLLGENTDKFINKQEIFKVKEIKIIKK